MEKQISKEQEKTLEKQQYRMVGNHSSVKVCGWTKNKIAGKGECYKEQFYGLNCHQCMQMTSSMYCANRCKFCWRGLKAPVSKEWYGCIDDVKKIVEGSIKAHIKLLQGFKGLKGADKKLIEEMENVKHVALSLTGESITYPKIQELLEEFHKKGITTFLVTNGQFPEQIEKVKKVTQMYLSLDAPDKKILKEIDRPLFPDYWERLLKSLEVIKNKKYRTAVRLTLIKGENDFNAEGYAELIKKGDFDFIEVKSYMWVGESQKNYGIEKMLYPKDVENFSKKLLKYLPDYELVDEHKKSVVVLLAKKGVERKLKF